MRLEALVQAVRASRGLGHKRDLDPLLALIGTPRLDAARMAVPVGDDCAALAIDGLPGYLLFAIEGLIEEFVAADPWFAGYSGVMVNVSDIAAMGGRPLAVVDAIWSRGGERAKPVLEGMLAAAAAYAVPVVGGHSNVRSEREQLSVAILGRANRLLSSFAAQPGDRLLMAVDLRGRYREPYPYWDASTQAAAARLRGDIELLPALAEEGLCGAAKDISMAGALGTALMLLECSGCGALIDATALPRPPAASLERWVATFPSFGFILAVAPGHASRVIARFAERDIACAEVGGVDDTRSVRLTDGEREALLWDFRQSPLMLS
jgi:AIR synthase-related protein